MLDKILGTGWKTVTGAIAWALAHSGLLSLALKLLGVNTGGVDVTAAVQAIGAAIAAVGVAHKLNNAWPALIAALKAAADAITAQGSGSS